jgi:opacity protein-like surface antigen
MKSYRILFVALSSFFCISLNAQFFVEGNLGFALSSHKTDNGGTTQKSTDNSLYLAPGFGTFLSEQFALGLSLDLTFSGHTYGPNPDSKTKSASIGASPFVRYYAMRWNKLAVFGQGNIGFAFSNSSVTTNGTKTEGPKDSNYYLSIFPGLSYDITDKLQLQTSLNFLRFGYVYAVSKDGSTKDTNSNFYGGATLDNIVSINAITIGAIYKF